MRIQSILLAAGRSNRYGSDKRLAEVDGESMAVRAAQNLLAAGLPVLAVVREPPDSLTERLADLEGVALSACPDADRGMGRSLAWGVARTADADAWLVALADMPRIEPATIRAVADALGAGTPIAAPVFRGKRGHPVGFSRRWLAPLLALDGDRGARALVEAHPEALCRIHTNDPGVLLDLDSPDDRVRLSPRPPES